MVSFRAVMRRIFLTMSSLQPLPLFILRHHTPEAEQWLMLLLGLSELMLKLRSNKLNAEPISA